MFAITLKVWALYLQENWGVVVMSDREQNKPVICHQEILSCIVPVLRDRKL
jgi:hypothetical protein